MAFRNEKLSEQDREWVSKLVNYESVRAISKWVHKFRLTSRSWWTSDNERNAYFLPLGGGGGPDDVGRLPYAVLVLDGQIVVFNVKGGRIGSYETGIHAEYEILNLVIPATHEHRREEIKALLREAYEEYVHADPFADGGTVANPNMTARWNIKSVNVEFK